MPYCKDSKGNIWKMMAGTSRRAPDQEGTKGSSMSIQSIGPNGNPPRNITHSRGDQAAQKEKKQAEKATMEMFIRDPHGGGIFQTIRGDNLTVINETVISSESGGSRVVRWKNTSVTSDRKSN